MSPEFKRTLKPDHCHSGFRVSFVNETTGEINKILVVSTCDPVFLCEIVLIFLPVSSYFVFDIFFENRVTTVREARESRGVTRAWPFDCLIYRFPSDDLQ